MLRKLKERMESPEGQEAMRKWAEKIKADQDRLDKRIDRFHLIYKDRLDEVMVTLMDKYESKAYRDKEYKLGYEPREKLYWFMFEYARKYGKECTDKKYLNQFTGMAYYLGSYVIQVMYGQGSAILIQEIEK